MARDEFSARNGTLSINQQTLSQREKTESRFRDSGKILGVGSKNSSSLFADSPIGYDGDIPDRTGGSGDLYNENSSNVYQAYANVIDNDQGVSGFGFNSSGISETAVMNYNHPDNPFITGEGIVDYNHLTTGLPNDEGIKAYRGFPDLVAGDIDNPTLDQEEPTPGLGQSPDGASYGHKTSEYREETLQLASMLGRHVDSSDNEGNGNSDTLGRYFTQRINEGE